MHMGRKGLIVKIMTTAIAAGAIAVAFFFVYTPYLVLTGDNGQEFLAYPIKNGEKFEVSFIHSVNKSEVSDIYTAEDGEIVLTGGTLSAFGAGVEASLSGDEYFEYLPDGTMMICGLHRRMDKLSYIVGTVYDHILTIDGKDISLRELCGKNERVNFSVEKRVYFGNKGE
jgi:hypothetical protein